MDRITELREALGGVHPGAANKVKDTLDNYVQGFIRHSPFFVLASANGDGDCDASPKGGKPGFVKIIDERTLLIPDIGGNRLFQSFENLQTNAKVGLVFMIPGMEVTVRVNGSVEILEASALTDRGIAPELWNPDANANIVQGLLLTVHESYFHCPRAFQFADLWNADTIARNDALSLKSLVNA